MGTFPLSPWVPGDGWVPVPFWKTQKVPRQRDPSAEVPPTPSRAEEPGGRRRAGEGESAWPTPTGDGPAAGAEGPGYSIPAAISGSGCAVLDTASPWKPSRSGCAGSGDAISTETRRPCRPGCAAGHRQDCGYPPGAPRSRRHPPKTRSSPLSSAPGGWGGTGKFGGALLCRRAPVQSQGAARDPLTATGAPPRPGAPRAHSGSPAACGAGGPSPGAEISPSEIARMKYFTGYL